MVEALRLGRKTCHNPTLGYESGKSDSTRETFRADVTVAWSVERHPNGKLNSVGLIVGELLLASGRPSPFRIEISVWKELLAVRLNRLAKIDSVPREIRIGRAFNTCFRPDVIRVGPFEQLELCHELGTPPRCKFQTTIGVP